ncbi:hypothetical protein H5T53_04785 [Candidatus Bipolaricaulota bacterium]|nr:hypothetical protein [Candidatus Bipolaricaulota bacterium]
MSEKKTRDRIEVTVGLAVQDLIAALKNMNTEEREDFIENLLAATSPEYLRSVDKATQELHGGCAEPDEQVVGSSLYLSNREVSKRENGPHR